MALTQKLRSTPGFRFLLFLTHCRAHTQVRPYRPGFRFLLFLTLWLAGCNSPHEKQIQRIDNALNAAGRFLISQQAADGSWSSKTYGGLRDGLTLTPMVAFTLFFLPQTGPSGRQAFEKSVAYLMEHRPHDSASDELPYPVYTASLAVMVLSLARPDSESRRPSLEAWLAYLLKYRLCSQNGWQPNDLAYGGWGYTPWIPQKPDNPEAALAQGDTNLSATVFGLGALRFANVPAQTAVYQEILTFVQRCQNFAEDPTTADSRFDDGGFFFSPTDSARNKAGVAGTDLLGRERYISYGSATADGLRALRRCGLPLHHPRVVAARAWLEKHFTVTHNPGHFAEDREALRSSIYFYYCWAMAHAFMALDCPWFFNSGREEVSWPAILASYLITHQQGDGSWKNDYGESKEDDPVIATSFAGATLAICRRMLTGKMPTVLSGKQE